MKHYHRWNKYGDPLGAATRPTAEDRFWAKVDKDGAVPEYAPHLGPCWIWLGFKGHGGYGRFTADGVSMPTHRFSYETVRGVKVPEGLQMDHLCRVRACCNPDHLEPVTPRENTRRSMSVPAFNARKTHCKWGHPFDEDNTYVNPTNGQRGCRTCSTNRAKADRQRKREAMT